MAEENGGGASAPKPSGNASGDPQFRFGDRWREWTHADQYTPFSVIGGPNQNSLFAVDKPKDNQTYKKFDRAQIEGPPGPSAQMNQPPSPQNNQAPGNDNPYNPYSPMAPGGAGNGYVPAWVLPLLMQPRFDPNYGAFVQGMNQQLALNAQLMGLYAHGQSLTALKQQPIIINNGYSSLESKLENLEKTLKEALGNIQGRNASEGSGYSSNSAAQETVSPSSDASSGKYTWKDEYERQLKKIERRIGRLNAWIGKTDNEGLKSKYQAELNRLNERYDLLKSKGSGELTEAQYRRLARSAYMTRAKHTMRGITSQYGDKFVRDVIQKFNEYAKSEYHIDSLNEKGLGPDGYLAANWSGAKDPNQYENMLKDFVKREYGTHTEGDGQKAYKLLHDLGRTGRVDANLFANRYGLNPDLRQGQIHTAYSKNAN